MVENKYAKLSELDGKSFTVTKSWGYSFKKWVAESKTMLTEDKWLPDMKGDRDWRKTYGLDTNAGKLDVSEAQLKNMLTAVYKNGVADINNVTFKVKKVIGQNDIPNYYFNVDYEAKEDTSLKQDVDELGW